MTDAEALEIAAAQHPRWRTLVIEQPEAWANVRAIAGGPPLPTRSAVPVPLTRFALDCLWRDPGCECAGIRCWANLGNREGGRVTTLSHCEACVSALLPR